MATEATRPKAGEVETRQAPEVTVEDRRIRGRIPYNVESRDLGGFTEIIEPGALNATKLDGLVATVDHAGVPIGRHPTTLELEARDDGLHWSVIPPQSRQDVIEAVQRGDLNAGSWRMVVGRDEWRGNVRHVHEIAVLRDVSVVTRPAYEAAQVEYRSEPDPAAGQEAPTMAEQADTQQTNSQTIEQADEQREQRNPAGSLRVEDRAYTPDRPMFQTLTEAFRSRGFPAETATISPDEYRAVTWGGTIDALNRLTTTGSPLGYDTRYVWNAVPNMNVAPGVTSVQVFQQTSRTMLAGSAVIRPIDATTTKPEVASNLNILTLPLKQVAGVESGIPNVYLEQAALASVVETDLRLQINDGLDSLFVTAVASSGFQTPGTNPLISIRKAITTLRASGYQPNYVFLTPSDSEAVDLLVSGISGGTADFVFGAGQFATGQLFGLNTITSKSVAASVVVDTRAHGKLYLAPISLARFEENFGKTNTSTVRLETNAVYGVEHAAAAVRIAAS